MGQEKLPMGALQTSFITHGGQGLQEPWQQMWWLGDQPKGGGSLSSGDEPIQECDELSQPYKTRQLVWMLSCNQVDGVDHAVPRTCGACK
jgi:hypothetical protein